MERLLLLFNSISISIPPSNLHPHSSILPRRLGLPSLLHPPPIPTLTSSSSSSSSSPPPPPPPSLSSSLLLFDLFPFHSRPPLNSSFLWNLHAPHNFVSAQQPPIHRFPFQLDLAYPIPSHPKSLFPKLIASTPTLSHHHNKVFNVGKVILGLALSLASLHLAHVLPAFANIASAAKAGAPPTITAGSGLIRNELLSSALTGFFAGCLHTLSGPDHLAALAPLSIGRTKMQSAAVGALWGCGHDAGQVIFGLIFLLLKDQLDIEVLRTWGTRVVGLTLLVIGTMGIKEASTVTTLENVEPDASGNEAVSGPSVGSRKKVGFATFATGIVHGLQPDALIMILPALALPSRLAGAAFLVMFFFGTVISMGSYTVFIGSCSHALKDRVPRITEKLTWVSSLIAIGLGLAILISQSLGFSLY